MLSAFNRSGEHSLYRPPIFNPRTENRVGYSYFNCPLSNRETFAFVLQVMVRSHVVLLNNFHCPLTILQCVIEAIVTSFKRMFGCWSGSHILEKVLKAVSPSVTNFYSSSTPSLIPGSVGIVAALEHVSPSHVLGSLFIAYRSAVFSFHTAHAMFDVGSVTGETAKGSSLKSVCDYISHRSTTAFTSEKLPSIFHFRLRFEYCPMSELVTTFRNYCRFPGHKLIIPTCP